MTDSGSMSSENVKGILDWIMYLLKKYRVDRLNLAAEWSNYEAQVLAGMIKDLEKIQEIIEENRN